MTISTTGAGQLIGLAADTKPTTYATGTRFFETDTGLEYYWNGTAWLGTATGAATFNNQTLKLMNPAGTFIGTVVNPAITATTNIDIGYGSFGTYVVYKLLSGTYVAKNLATNAIEFSSAAAGSAENAIQTAITNAGTYGTVYIHGPDTFSISSSFTGFNLLYHQEIYMGHGTRISLPTGYAGSVFKILQSNSCQQVQIHGGMIQELTTPSKLWTAFEINSDTASGVWNIHIRDNRVYAAGKAIAIKTDGTGWSNGNIFDGNYWDSCVIGVSFEHTGTFTAFQSGVNNNTFSNNIHQAQTGTTNGFKDVNGRRNYFLNNYIADFTGAMSTMNITANAADTQISGGSATALNFADLSPATNPTIIHDAYQNSIAFRRKTWAYEDQVAMTAPSSPSTGTTRRYTKTLDANNDGLFYKARVNGAVVEVAI